MPRLPTRQILRWQGLDRTDTVRAREKLGEKEQLVHPVYEQGLVPRGNLH